MNFRFLFVIPMLRPPRLYPWLERLLHYDC